MVLAVLLGFALCLSLEDAMLRLVNEYRRSRNMDTLYCLEALQKAADYQAQVMCTTGRLTHEGIDKYHHALDDRLRMFDFVGENIGENIARQENDEYAEVFKLWAKSGEHRKNILGDYTYTGISTCRDKNGYRFWIQVFGKDVSNSFIRTLRSREMGSFSGKCMDGAGRNPLCFAYQERGDSTGAQKNNDLSDGYLSACDGPFGCRRYDMSNGGARSAETGTARPGESVQSCRGKGGGHAQNTEKSADGFLIDESTRRSLQEQVARIVVEILQTGIIQGLRFFGQKDGYGTATKQVDGMYPQSDTSDKKKDMLNETDMQFSQKQPERGQGEVLDNKKKDAKENTPNGNSNGTVQADKGKTGSNGNGNGNGSGSRDSYSNGTNTGSNGNGNGNGSGSRDLYSNGTNTATNRGESHSQAGEAPQQNQREGQTPDASTLNQSGQSASRATNTNGSMYEKQHQDYGQGQNGGMEKCAVDKFCKKIDIGIPLYLGAQWSEKK